VLERARAAPDQPWPEKKQRVWQIIFPNKAKWLPDDEADQPCFEFAQEIERLKLAARQRPPCRRSRRVTSSGGAAGGVVMRGKLAVGGLLLGLALWPAGAGASGDGGCEAKWVLAAPTFACASRVVIGPGNDTRVNLLLLLNDRAGLAGRGLAVPKDEGAYYGSFGYGETFLDWDRLTATFYPRAVQDPYREPAEFEGSRCQNVRAAGEQFLAAVKRNARVPAGDRQTLAQARDAVLGVCKAQYGDPYEGIAFDKLTEAQFENRIEAMQNAGRRNVPEAALPASYASPEAREFAAYLAGAAEFYRGDWAKARERFTAARAANDAWVRETAYYMAARSDLAAAMAPGFDKWGDFDVAKADKGLAAQAETALAAYLAAYPSGRYAASARGLFRRAAWLEGAVAKQGKAYAGLVQAADAKSAATARLIEEIDTKYLLGKDAGQAFSGPWLLAAHDLLRMRHSADPTDDQYDRDGLAPLTAGELAGQAAVFAGQPALYDFLRANFAFYVARDYRAVLRLLPDEAQKPAYTPLQFSRQALRGLALGALHDRNEAGFWQELLGGANGAFQRPTVELALALDWERAGQVARVFAPGSPIADPRIRSILLQYAAGPAVLRDVAGKTGRSTTERDIAAFTLLYKELLRGTYGQAASDLALVRANAPNDWSEAPEGLPAGYFTRGKFAESYPCPALHDTIARLAANPREVKARLCLGDFYRLNGFDAIDLDTGRAEGELGSFAAYPGVSTYRGRIYADIIREAGVAHEDQAYALYRAIQCYAPSGYSSCGGAEVPVAQRKAWFQRLKGAFGDTRWAKEAKYYW
jgi:hypothetical protein